MFIKILMSIIAVLFPLYVLRLLLKTLVDDIKASSFWFATVDIILLVYMANTFITLLKELYTIWI